MVQFLEYITYDEEHNEQLNKLPIFLGYNDFLYFESKGIDDNSTYDDTRKYIDEMIIRALKHGHKKWFQKYAYSDEEIDDIVNTCGFQFFELLPNFRAPKKK